MSDGKGASLFGRVALLLLTVYALAMIVRAIRVGVPVRKTITCAPRRTTTLESNSLSNEIYNRFKPILPFAHMGPNLQVGDPQSRRDNE